MRRDTPPERALFGFRTMNRPGEAHVGRQRRALVATLFLVDLDDDVLTFIQDVTDVRFAAGLDRLDEVLAGDLF